MKELFDQLIGTPPASRVDIKRIMARQDRLTVVRRIAAGVGVAAVAMLPVVVTTTLRPAAVDRPLASTAPPPVSPSPAPETAKDKAIRVENAWKKAVARLLPDAQWRAGRDDSQTGTGGDVYDESFSAKPPSLLTQTNADGWDEVPWHTSDSLYRLFAIVKNGDVENGIFFRTHWRAKDDLARDCKTTAGVMTCRSDDVCMEASECHRFQGPDGIIFSVTKTTNVIPEWTLPQLWLTVWMRSADGTRISELTITNRPGTDAFPGPKSTNFVLSEEQMCQLLLEPGLLI